MQVIAESPEREETNLVGKDRFEKLRSKEQTNGGVESLNVQVHVTKGDRITTTTKSSHDGQADFPHGVTFTTKLSAYSAFCYPSTPYSVLPLRVARRLFYVIPLQIHEGRSIRSYRPSKAARFGGITALSRRQVRTFMRIIRATGSTSLFRGPENGPNRVRAKNSNPIRSHKATGFVSYLTNRVQTIQQTIESTQGHFHAH